ncbi:MAG TPA: hypothetical protein VGS12_17720 [Caulobacteraceae bacterium]|nr:hypothetical protein [Caulobacteraceae bacterium]
MAEPEPRQPDGYTPIEDARRALRQNAEEVFDRFIDGMAAELREYAARNGLDLGIASAVLTRWAAQQRVHALEAADRVAEALEANAVRLPDLKRETWGEA